MFVPKLDVLGWGRGGLQGEGSGVVGVGEELVLGDNAMGLHGRWGRGRFLCLEWRVLIPGVGVQPITLAGPRRDVAVARLLGWVALHSLA